MNRILQFALRPGVPIRDVEETLHLAMFAVEGLTGRVRVSLDANYLVLRPDPPVPRFQQAAAVPPGDRPRLQNVPPRWAGTKQSRTPKIGIPRFGV